MTNNQNKESTESIEHRYTLIKAQFDTLLDAAVDAIILIDHLGRIRLLNRSAEKLLGYQAHEMIGQNVSMLMPTDVAANHNGYIENYINGGQPKIIGFGRVVNAQRKDGATVPVELTVGDVKIEGRHFFVGILRDVSQRLAIDKEVQQQREALAHASRISVMGEMAAGIAHEMNQPLSAILNYSNAAINVLRSSALSKQASSEQEMSCERLEGILKKVGDQAYRAGQIIQGFRNFVKHKEVNKKPERLSILIAEALELMALDTRWMDIHFELDEAEFGQALVQVDAIQIQQVLVNLLRNALDAIELTKNEMAEKQVCLSLSAESQSFLGISVSDTGDGVDDTVQQELFEPFATTKESGMGMGLAICNSIIRSHGGVLRVAPSRLGGATFTFTLPRYLDD